MAVVIAAVFPLAYLFIRAAEVDADAFQQTILRWRNVQLLGRTAALAAGVLAGGLLLAAPMAWLSTRGAIRGRRVLTLLAIMPLAVPGYVMAYALRSIGGYQGVAHRLFDTRPLPLSGYTGAVLALTLCTYPYLFLNLRSAILGMDGTLEEASRTLGRGRVATWFHVVRPQLMPGLLAGSLLVLLHVLGDLGVVSLMRYETFSLAIYQQYTIYDPTYAAWLALALLAITAVLLWGEAMILGDLRLDSPHAAAGHRVRHAAGRWWQWPAYLTLGSIALAGVALPVTVVAFWASHDAVRDQAADALSSAWASVQMALPAALLAGLLVLPIAHIAARHPSKRSKLMERAAYFSYATPPLAFALAFAFIAPRFDHWLQQAGAPDVFRVYQTLPLLIVALTLHFLAEAIGPVRSSMKQASPQLEEAARTLGSTRLTAFTRVTLPLVRRGVMTGMLLVFLSAMKELPITVVLAPNEFRPLSYNAWSYASEADFAGAAPHALMILLTSTVLVTLLFLREGGRR